MSLSLMSCLVLHADNFRLVKDCVVLSAWLIVSNVMEDSKDPKICCNISSKFKKNFGAIGIVDVSINHSISFVFIVQVLHNPIFETGLAFAASFGSIG